MIIYNYFIYNYDSITKMDLVRNVVTEDVAVEAWHGSLKKLTRRILI